MIIAIESASTDLSLALADPDGRVFAIDGWTAGRRQGSELLPRLLALLDLNRRRVTDASAVVVGTGPGSFTGLRVGMSVAKGICAGLALPIVGVPSLVAWLDAEPDRPAALVRAGARESHLLERGSEEPQLVERDAITERGLPLVAPVELAEAFGLADTLPPHRAAVALAARAAARLAQDAAGDDLRRIEPIYLRAPRGIGP
jgi:tRNA threonylcarbamoyl adenosine modification protein YeaZ